MARWTGPRSQVAVKEHRCGCCSRRIGAGEVYWRQRGFDSGDAWTWKYCVHCDAVTAAYDPRDVDDAITFDGFQAWVDDGARSVAELRAQAGWRMRWRSRSGALLGVPEVPVPEPVHVRYFWRAVPEAHVTLSGRDYDRAVSDLEGPVKRNERALRTVERVRERR